MNSRTHSRMLVEQIRRILSRRWWRGALSAPPCQSSIPAIPLSHAELALDGSSPPGTSTSQLMGPSSYPLAYYNMPKAACTTIKNILFRMQHGHWIDQPLEIHRRIRYQNAVPKGMAFAQNRRTLMAQQPYTSFTFVRNPGRRIYSAFVEKIWATGKYHIPGARTFLIDTLSYSLPALDEGCPPLEDVRRAFKQFLCFVKQGNTPLALDPHWASQYARIQKLNVEDSLNFVGRVETFSRDMKLILLRAGWKKPKIADHRFNEGPKAPYSLDDILDDEIALLLLELYENDYLAFGYEPPSRSLVLSHRKVGGNDYRGQVVVGRPDRLGMRLTMFVQAWRFAREIGYQTVVMWPSNEINRENDPSRDSDSYPIGDFLDIEASMKAIGNDSLVFKDAQFPADTVFVDKEPLLKGRFPGMFIRDKARELPKVISINNRAVGLRFKGEDPEAVRRSCADLFRTLVPSREVRDAFGILRSSLGDEPSIALHVRRGDIYQTLRDRIAAVIENPEMGLPPDLVRYLKMLATKVAPLVSYRKLVAAHQASVTRILLFTDSPSLVGKITSEIGASVPVIPVHEIATPSANSNQRSFAELLLLSECQVLIGTRSAYSRAAHLFGRLSFHDASRQLGEIEHMQALLTEFAGDLLATNPALIESLLQSTARSASNSKG